MGFTHSQVRPVGRQAPYPDTKLPFMLQLRAEAWRKSSPTFITASTPPSAMDTSRVPRVGLARSKRGAPDRKRKPA